MLQRTIALAAVAAVALWSSGAGAQDQKVYGVLLKTLSNPFWGAMEQGVKDGAAAAGVEYYLQAVESD
jgi:ABC-type sugar transport system substrate-binding protein